MLNKTTAIISSILAIVLFALYSVSASAHPVFAQKHNMRCSGCHITPITDGALNSNGWSFKKNGYKFPGWGNPGGGGNNNGNNNCIKIGKITICQ